MPIYEFVCQSCANEFERIQSFSDSSTPACPNCSSANVERQLGKPAIHFKGSGWYINDSKKAAKESANGQSKSGTDKSTPSKTDGEGAGSAAKETAGASSSSKPDSSSGAADKAAKDSKS